MVGRIIKILHREINGLHETAYLLAFFSFLSQLLALVRDRIFAATFGAGQALDIYYASFRIPDLINVSVASLFAFTILIPFLSEKMKKNEKEMKDFFNSIFSAFFLMIVAVSVLAFFLIPYIMPQIFPGLYSGAGGVGPGDGLVAGLGSSGADTLNTLSRILLLSPILLGLSNLFAGLIQVKGRMFIYAISPLLYNIGIIVGALFLYPIFGMKGIVFGVIIGAFMHAFIQVPYLVKNGLLYSIWPRISSIDWGDVKRVLGVSIPRTLTLSTNQVTILGLFYIASLMTAGSISIFNLAMNLQSVPLAIIGVSYSSAVFPILSRLFAEGKRTEYLEKMIICAKHIIFWSMPVSLLFIVLRAHIVRVLLGASRNFDWNDTRLTAACLAIFTVTLVFQSLMLVFVRAYYSEGKTTKPLFANIFSAFVTLALAYFFVKIYSAYPFFKYAIESLFKINAVDGSTVILLVLAYSFGVIFNTFLHWSMFHVDFPKFTKPVLKMFFQATSASIIAGYATYAILNLFEGFFDISVTFQLFLHGFLAGLVGIITYAVLMLLLKNEEIAMAWQTIHSRVFKGFSRKKIQDLDVPTMPESLDI